jgi:FkbM family methyltransferase
MNQKNSPRPFISYAQNLEDVILWRALKHVQSGVYVDVGAQHPVVDSVSKAFYEQGWRGVHVEPVPQYAELLRQDRPDEVVLQVALGEKAGILDLYMVPDTGLSTGVEAHAKKLQAQHGFASQTIQTAMLPMRTALASLAGQQVHWLKIDVEGFEAEVLRGWDPAALRPWVILIEATVPLSTELRYEASDRILVDAGYQFAYFDGLNRFYVAQEHGELISALQTPPNVFDNVQLSSSSAWCAALVSEYRVEHEAYAAQLEATRAELALAQARAAEAEATSLRSAARIAEACAAATRAEARAVRAEERASFAEAMATHASDRATQAEARALTAANTPLRRLATAIAEGRIGSGIKRRIKVAVRIAAIVAGRHRLLKRSAVRILNWVPPLRNRLRAMLAAPHSAQPTSVEHPLPISLDTALILRQLQIHQRTQRSESN